MTHPSTSPSTNTAPSSPAPCARGSHADVSSQPAAGVAPASPAGLSKAEREARNEMVAGMLRSGMSPRQIDLAGHCSRHVANKIARAIGARFHKGPKAAVGLSKPVLVWDADIQWYDNRMTAHDQG